MDEMQAGPDTRIGGWAGVAAAVFLGVSFMVVKAPPDLGAPADEIKRYALDNRSGGLLQVLVYAVALPFFVAFMVGIARRFSGASGVLAASAALAGSIGMAMSVIGGAAFWVPAWDEDIARTAGADVFRFGWDMGYVLYMVGFVTLGAALVAFGSAALRSERAKAWYSWSTVVLGVAMAISSLGILSSGVATAGLFTFLVLILWTLVGGILLIREA